MTHRDRFEDDLFRTFPRDGGEAAARDYLAVHAADKPPFPWPFALAVLVIVAVLVAACALSWDAIAAGVAFMGLAPAAGAQFVAEAGRDAGVVR